MDRIKGKVALITGAASGIGRATAKLFAKEGAKVVIGDINVEGGKKVAEEINREGAEAIFVEHDVTIEPEWENIIKETLAKYDKLDILVNNAGTMILKAIEDMTMEEWRFQLGANLDGVFLGIKHGIRTMKKSGGGSIINTSSTAAFIGTIKDGAAYTVSKAGVHLLTKSAALECSKMGYDYNIRVNSIHPGSTRTPLTEGLMKDDFMRKLTETTLPIGHQGDPIDIAYAMLYLASDESKFATGTGLVVDGGMTAL